MSPLRTHRRAPRPVSSWARELRWLSCAVWMLAVAFPVGAEEPARPSVEIGWTEVAPDIDGRLSPGEWAAAGHIDGFTQALPDEGAAATERTEVFIMTDEDFLYVGARLWDSAPEEIVAQVMSRDGRTLDDDRFSITIDPFLDRQNGYFLQVNPNAVRRDALIEGPNVESSWDGRWYAKTSVDEEGWTVEIALPYQTINFDPEADVWGLNLARGIRRRDEIDRWADPVRERFLVAMGRAGDLVGMKGIRQGRGIQAIPSLTARRVDDVNRPSSDPTADQRHFSRVDPSFDLFYKVTPSVTTALTVNTDFGETEVDERQVNFGRFALFFPERRDFFLQDALIFDFGGLAENGRPFFSRRIGLDAGGDPVRLLAGGKVTGRVGRLKFGVQNVVIDEDGRADQQNLLVARAAANFGESQIGAILTNGDPAGNATNTVAGLDFLYRNTNFGAGKTLRASAWVQGSYNDPDRSPGDDDPIVGAGYAFGGRVEYPNDRHNWEFIAQEFDDDFDPALGFANRVGIREFNGRYRRRWRPKSRHILLVDSQVNGFVITEQGRQVETAAFGWRAFDLLNYVGDGVRLVYEHRYDVVPEPDTFSSFSVPVGRYHFDEGQIRFQTSPNRPVSAVVTAGYGTFYDGTRFRTSGDVSVRLTKHVQVGAFYGYDNLRLPNGDENIHILRARLNLFFTPDISWITLVQYDSVTDQIGINSRFRWIIEDGRELFLVVNQGLDARDDVRATRTAPLAKLQWTFRF